MCSALYHTHAWTCLDVIVESLAYHHEYIPIAEVSLEDLLNMNIMVIDSHFIIVLWATKNLIGVFNCRCIHHTFIRKYY